MMLMVDESIDLNWCWRRRTTVNHLFGAPKAQAMEDIGMSLQVP
jgi:hypothetical protein